MADQILQKVQTPGQKIEGCWGGGGNNEENWEVWGIGSFRVMVIFRLRKSKNHHNAKGSAPQASKFSPLSHGPKVHRQTIICGTSVIVERKFMGQMDQLSHELNLRGPNVFWVKRGAALWSAVHLPYLPSKLVELH